MPNSNKTNSDQKSLPFILQFSAGGIAGVSEILTMYPLDVIKTRLQLVQSGAASSVQPVGIIKGLRQIVQAEGFSRLYRGILSPLLVEAPKRATKFAANEFYSKMYLNFFNQSKMTQPLSILTGVSAGMTEACLVVSFELVKIRLQDRKFTGKYSGMMDCVKKVYAEEGFLTFAKGLEPTLWRHAMWNGGYFGVIHFVRSIIPKPGTNRDMQEEQLETEFQKSKMEKLKNSLRISNESEHESRGIGIMVQSNQAAFPDNQPINHSAPTSLPNEHSSATGAEGKRCNPKPNSDTSSALLHDFLCGAIGGTVGTMLNTPFDVVKTRIQGHIGPHPLYHWAIPSLFRIWKDEGFKALFKGFKPKVIRLGPGGGILLVVYDQVTKFFRNALYGENN